MLEIVGRVCQARQGRQAVTVEGQFYFRLGLLPVCRSLGHCRETLERFLGGGVFRSGAIAESRTVAF